METSVVHFEVGEPDFNTAAPIIEAGKRALEEGFTKYTNAVGAARTAGKRFQPVTTPSLGTRM